MRAKISLLVLIVICGVLQWQGLQGHLAYKAYNRLADEVGKGRLEQSDARKIEALLTGSIDGTIEAFNLHALRTVGILHMYNVDLVSDAKEIPPLQSSSDVDLIKARNDALQYYRSAITYTPHDGELWLRIAILARSLDLPDNEYLTYLNWSEKLSPNEGWLLRLRSAYGF